MGPVLRRLARAADQLQAELVRSHALGAPVPALDRKVARLLGAMRLAARLTVSRTEGLNQGDVKPTLDWRVDKVKALVKVIKSEDKPASLGVLLGLPQQARGLASGLSGKVSDLLVAEHTAAQEAKASAARNEVLIFQPERDACVRCLKYAGRFRSPGETFQGGLSFDPDAPKPDKKDRIAGPPIHPHCRCNLEVIPAEAAVSNAKALQREAERSVLKGWALDNEGNAVRRRAAQALLDSNVIAPKTVLTEARKRLKSDDPFVRDVP